MQCTFKIFDPQAFGTILIKAHDAHRTRSYRYLWDLEVLPSICKYS